LTKIIDRIARTRAALARPIYWSTVNNEFRVIREDILDAIKNDVFLYIEPDKAEYYQQGDYCSQELFGDTVSDKFPSAAEDIRAAGNCYATGNHTACVFHLMRVAEHGLRAVAHILEVPFQHENWHNIIDDIESKIKGMDQWPGGLSKEQAQDFYSSIAMECRHFRNKWQNHVMHTRAMYDSYEALSAMTHVRAFMQKAAEYLEEVRVYDAAAE
jgi:hypothetical protein